MKVGIVGGTFNPPHIGHLILGEEIREKLGFEKIFFIPTNISPHKEPCSVSASHRFNMVKLAIEGNKFFEALDIEIKKGNISYTIDTIKQLKEKFPEDDFYLIMGSDLANTFSTWKSFEELKRLANIVVAQREDFPLKEKNSFIVVNITQVDISSSRIREKVKEGVSTKQLVKDKVASYIERHKLYEK